MQNAILTSAHHPHPHVPVLRGIYDTSCLASSVLPGAQNWLQKRVPFCSVVWDYFPVIIHPHSAAQRSPHIMSLGDNDSVTCFVMAVKIGVITWRRCVARGPGCGTGSDQHRGGCHCRCPKPQAICPKVTYMSHFLPPLSQVAMPN